MFSLFFFQKLAGPLLTNCRRTHAQTTALESQVLRWDILRAWLQVTLIFEILLSCQNKTWCIMVWCDAHLYLLESLSHVTRAAELVMPNDLGQA